MSNLQVFNFNSNQVRIVMINNNPYWVLKDVCRVLKIKNDRDVVSRLNSKGVDSADTLTKGGVQKMTVINESNLYKTIFQSRTEEAEKFQDWTTEEVLPTIRKTGTYGVPTSFKEALLLAAKQQEEIEEKNLLLLEQKPKVDFYDQVASSKDAIAIGDMAKALNMEIGRNTMFELLREKGILQSNNIPYQRYIDAGYFRVIEQRYTYNGEVRISLKTLVYQRGMNYIRKLLASS